MTEYIIITEVLHGEIESKITSNGAPVEPKSLIPRYQKIYKSIEEAHIEAMNLGNLEKISSTLHISQ